MGHTLMRKIEEQIITAFINDKTLTINNTSTYDNSIYLHNHEIIKRSTDGGSIYFNLAGYNTRTTRSRINAVLHQYDYGYLSTKNWSLFYTPSNGNLQPIDADVWIAAT